MITSWPTGVPAVNSLVPRPVDGLGFKSARMEEGCAGGGNPTAQYNKVLPLGSGAKP